MFWFSASGPWFTTRCLKCRYSKKKIENSTGQQFATEAGPSIYVTTHQQSSNSYRGARGAWLKVQAHSSFGSSTRLLPSRSNWKSNKRLAFLELILNRKCAIFICREIKFRGLLIVRILSQCKSWCFLTMFVGYLLLTQYIPDTRHFLFFLFVDELLVVVSFTMLNQIFRNWIFFHYFFLGYCLPGNWDNWFRKFYVFGIIPLISERIYWVMQQIFKSRSLREARIKGEMLGLSMKEMQKETLEILP